MMNFMGIGSKVMLLMSMQVDNIILIETMNQLTKDYTKKQIQHLIDIFVACSRYELAFWQMSWDKSC